jgi:hypothetical protein
MEIGLCELYHRPVEHWYWFPVIPCNIDDHIECLHLALYGCRPGEFIGPNCPIHHTKQPVWMHDGGIGK